jgi:oligoendopeptidase F
MLGTEHVRWDLSAMYADITDPRIDADIADLKDRAKRFHEKYRGKLKELLGPAITDYAEIDMLSNKIMVYLSLRQATDVADAAIRAKSAAAERELSAASGEYLTFFGLELVALGGADLEKLYASDAVVLKHKPWIEHERIFKPHVLSEPVESALVKRTPFGAGSWAEFFDEVETDLSFPWHGEKKSLTEMWHLLTESKDPAERAEALRIVNDGLRGGFAKYAAQTLYMVVGAESVEEKERKYKNPMDARNKDNRIPDEVVDVLHRTVMDAGAPLVARYYRLKAKLLGLPILAWSDRNAPMPFADTAIVPFNEARKIVSAAYRSFSPTLADIVETFFTDKRIDAPVHKAKKSGGFNCSVILPGQKPLSFTFLNYLGSNDDVMTLAHELGHGVHGMLAGAAQGPLMFHAPIAYCETASVFGEMTTFAFLKEQLAAEGDGRTLLALIMAAIDGTMNTVVRQISFSNFERRVHGMDASYAAWHEQKKLSAEELNNIWRQVTEELYGKDGDVFTYENIDSLWTYISHFHNPFYVYGYAFGELLTQSLYAARPRLGEKFEPLYIDMLRSGATRDVVGLLAPFGLDPRDAGFWAGGIAFSLGALVGEAETLAAKIGF